MVRGLFGSLQRPSDEQHGNGLSELFDAFTQTKADADLGPPFSLALHWYQNSNIRAGGMEGAIILGLTALDLLGAMVVVDCAGVMTDKYDKLVAKDKLARLFGVQLQGFGNGSASDSEIFV